jgi:hypothetical protein
MLSSAVSPANLHLYLPHSNSADRSIPAPHLPFFVHTSKFRILQLLFFDTLTDTPGVGSTYPQTLPKTEPVLTCKSTQPALPLSSIHPLSLLSIPSRSTSPITAHLSTSTHHFQSCVFKSQFTHWPLFVRCNSRPPVPRLAPRSVDSYFLPVYLPKVPGWEPSSHSCCSPLRSSC